MTRLDQARRIAGALAAALMVAACGGGSSTASNSTIDLPVASILPLTGSANLIGTPIARAFELGAEDVNAHGGIHVGGKTYRLAVTTEDDATSPDQAVALFRKHLDSGDVKLIFGPDSTPETLPVVELVKNRDVFQVSCCSGTFALNLYHDPSKYPNIVATQNVTQQHQACYIPQYIQIVKPKRVAAILNNNPTGQLVARNLPTYLSQNGVTAADTDIEFFASSTTDFTPILTKVAAKNPDLVILGIFTAPPVTILRQANDLGLTSRMVFAGTEGAGIADPVTAIGKQLNGWMWPQLGPAFDSGNATLEHVRQLWKAKYAEDPATTSYLTSTIYIGYDDAQMLKIALEKAGSVSNVAAIARGWRQIGAFRGINQWHINSDGISANDEQVGVIKNGKTTYVDCHQTPVAAGSV